MSGQNSEPAVAKKQPLSRAANSVVFVGFTEYGGCDNRDSHIYGVIAGHVITVSFLQSHRRKAREEPAG